MPDLSGKAAEYLGHLEGVHFFPVRSKAGALVFQWLDTKDPTEIANREAAIAAAELAPEFSAWLVKKNSGALDDETIIDDALNQSYAETIAHYVNELRNGRLVGDVTAADVTTVLKTKRGER